MSRPNCLPLFADAPVLTLPCNLQRLSLRATVRTMISTPQTSPTLLAAGRWLIALYFFIPGVMKFAAFPLHVSLMEAHNVPFAAPLLIIAALVNIVGSLLLFSNRFVRFTSLGFVLYILIINVTLHDFWNFDGTTAAHEVQNFVKNLGILAGLLILAGSTAWRPPRTVL
jgi:putative oxidoreductase